MCIKNSACNDKYKIIETCPECGKPKKVEVMLLGKPKELACSCKCVTEADEREEQLIQARERRELIEQRLKDSFMNEREKRITFDNMRRDEENTPYIEAALRYCKDRRYEEKGLLFYGEPGHGKTALVAAMANFLICEGVKVVFANVPRMIRAIQSSFKDSEALQDYEIIDRLKNADLLILDDLGAEHQSDWASSLIYTILDERYSSLKPVVITSNLSVADLRNHLSSADGVMRSFDRLVEMVKLVEINGKNYRCEAAKSSTFDFFN